MALELTELAVELYQTSDMSIAEAVEEVTEIFEHFAITVEEAEDGILYDDYCECDECCYDCEDCCEEDNTPEVDYYCDNCGVKLDLENIDYSDLDEDIYG